MPDKLESAVAEYLAALNRIRSTGGGTDERSYYPALSMLLNAIGDDLRPRVFCVSELASTGAGHPDFGLYTANQCQKGAPRPGALPERGVVEVKGVADDAWVTADTRQVSGYWAAYRLVFVTNYRDFLLIGEDAAGRPVRFEHFRLADDAEAFWEATRHPERTAREHGRALGEYLRRALAISASLTEPKDVAWILASYARDALQRVESAGEIPALATVRTSLEQALDAPLSGDGTERAAIYLSNALTGWEPVTHKPLPFPDLEDERQRAENVKQHTRILVILGNPPYNGYAGMAVEEERALSTEYRRVRRVRPPEGQGLNDLYVRFFRMAERRIAEKTGEGVICFVSNYSWLDGLSFTGMRERFLDAFDAIRIDCLNGDKYKTGKLTPDGAPDPSIFSTAHNREGIQVGAAIATLVRRRDHVPAAEVRFRHLWGQDKRQRLAETADADEAEIYESLIPELKLGLPLMPVEVSDGYLDWPMLPDLMPVSFPGVKTSRDDFLVAIDRETLERRLADYFDPKIGHDELRRKYPSAMTKSGRYDPDATRDVLLKRGMLKENIVPYAYRPFDIRWIYWEPETKLLDEKRSEYRPHVFPDNLWLEAREKQPKDDFTRGNVVTHLADDMGNGLSNFFPIYLREGEANFRSNASKSAGAYLDANGCDVADLFGHSVATIHSPAYRAENAGALRMDWPRIPLPGNADLLRHSADLGHRLSNLFAAADDVAGVSEDDGVLSEVVGLARPARQGGGNFSGMDFALAAGWGRAQRGGIVMPGRGRVVERGYTPEERSAFSPYYGAAADRAAQEAATVALLGETTFDVYLNADAYWSNVPANVWRYTLGGYQALKKWLSYRERDILGRPLTPQEVRAFAEIVRRIASILLLGPALDASYAAVKADALCWTGPDSLHAFAAVKAAE